MLHIIGTPIGNLKDITLRALEGLKACSYILAEDTRVTKHLLAAYGITTPLKSYHAFSERKYLEPILDDLKAEVEIGLVSDAGMPGISDPGNLLIQHCREQELPITIYPGPSACLTALVAAGLADHPFQFRGFFPQKKQKEEVIHSLYYQGVSVYYEAPHRILDTLALFPETTTLWFARELTKKFEEIKQGTAAELLSHFSKNPPRGEFVLLIKGYSIPEADPRAFVKELELCFAIDQKMALKLASELLGIPKREVYKKCLDQSS